MSYRIGVDLGGTNIEAGLMDDSLRILASAGVKTQAPRSAGALCADMDALCRALASEAGVGIADIRRVGVGSPGIIENGVIRYANNLGLRDAPLAELLEASLGIPVSLCGDANAAAYGEYLAGAGRGCDPLIVMTAGTGIGGGMILKGRVYEGFNGSALELGHMIIQRNGRTCTCGKKGCLEAYCSASGLIYFTEQGMRQDPDSILWDLCERDSRKITGKTAFDAMRAGDASARNVVEAFLDDLAVGVSNVIHLFQPERLCIGGGLSKEGDTLIHPLRKRVETMIFPGLRGRQTEIVAAELGNDAGIIGAAFMDI
jgi:glucokinase